MGLTSEACLQRARLFADSEYKSVGIIRQMQETSRRYFATDIRKGRGFREPMRELRLVLALFGLFEIQKGDEKPKYDELTIPGN